MGILVRVNRDHAKHLWTVFSLTHHHRIGRADGVLLRDVTFTHEGPSVWADGELWTWSALQLDPKFHERLEARTVAYLGQPEWPVEFREGKLYLQGLSNGPLAGAGWLRILGRSASVIDPRYAV